MAIELTITNCDLAVASEGSFGPHPTQEEPRFFHQQNKVGMSFHLHKKFIPVLPILYKLTKIF